MSTLVRSTRAHKIRPKHRPEVLSGRLVADSVRLAECSIVTIDTIITAMLEELCRIEGADQAGWFLVREDRYSVARYTSAPPGGVIEAIGNLDQNQLPWCRAHLRKGRAVIIRDLSEIPFRAKLDRTRLESLGIRSLALVPVENRKPRSGVFAILSTKQTCDWSEALQGNCALMGGMLISAHGRKMAGMQRETSDAYFREIFHNASVGMAIEDTSGRMLFVNDALCRMLGYSEPEMMRLTCRDFSHPGDYERELEMFQKVLSGVEQSYEIEKRFFHRDGSVVWAKVYITLLREYPNGSRVVLGIVENITAQKEAQEKLVTSQKEVESLASRLILSQEEERSRIARELHDDIGQRLSMATSEVHVLEEFLRRNGRSQLKPIEKLAKELDALTSDIHGLSHRLHSSQLQHLGLTAALRDLCRQMGRLGLEVEFEEDDDGDLIPTDVTLCLYRIAQEALTNTLNHSGQTCAELSLWRTEAGYSLSIRDEGKGFEVKSDREGLGLISMRERLRPFGGQFSVISSPGHGTQILVTVPRKDRLKKRPARETAA